MNLDPADGTQPPDTPPPRPPDAAREATQFGIETRGVDTIPESDRTSGPKNVASILVGSNLALGVVIFGWLPATFGLDFWASITSMITGTALGIAFVSPLALVSLRTATNLSTSSGAQFGVRGRLIGSAIGLLLSLGYAALTLWTGGAAIVGPLHRLLGVSNGGGAYSVTYLVLALLTVAAAIFGYQLLQRMSAYLAVAMSVLIVLGLVAFAGRFSPAPVVHGYLLGGFWPTWALSTVAVGLSGPIAFITLVGDYTRYVSPRRHKPRRVLLGTALGMVGGLMIPQLFGTFTSFAARAASDYVEPLVAAAPVWFAPLILFNGVFGTIGNAGILIYSMGLDLDAIIPRFNRVQATSVVCLLATTLVFLGYFVWDAEDAVTAFVLLLTAVGSPWAVITLIGFVRCRGRYDADALQVFNRRSRGGIYWYYGGWNLRAAAAWAIGSTVGLLSVDTTLYTGPVVNWAGGLDLSFLLSGITTAVAYLLLASGQQQPLPTPERGPAPGAASPEPTSPDRTNTVSGM